MMTRDRLAALLERFPQQRILVLGDYFLDKYLDIDRALAETSLETGLEAHQVVCVRTSPGASGNVAANLCALGVPVVCLSVVGDDGEGYVLRRELRARGADPEPLIVAPERMTPTYTKPMMHEADGVVHELSRLDHKNRTPLPVEIEEQVIARLRQLVPQVQGVVVADQVGERNVGVVTDRVRETLAALAAAHPDLPFIVDSRERVGEYRGMLLKPNDREALHAVDGGWRDAPSLAEAERAGLMLAARAGRPVFVTVGPQGTLVCAGGRAQRVPAVQVAGPIDIVGAGDSTLAGIIAALCSGATPVEAAGVGNLVASVTIRQLGTTGIATPEQVLAAL
jgi:rfaE bifunctional protein kinase chain/domain